MTVDRYKFEQKNYCSQHTLFTYRCLSGNVLIGKNVILQKGLVSDLLSQNCIPMQVLLEVWDFNHSPI